MAITAGTLIRGRLLAAAALGAALLLSACGSSTTATLNPSPSPTASAAVRIGDGGTAVGTPVAKVEVRDGSFVYQGNGLKPAVTVKVGDVVEWDWGAGLTDAHNVTFATPPLLLDNIDPRASSPHMLNAGASWQVKFTGAGTYTYVCTFHSINMRGTVLVTP